MTLEEIFLPIKQDLAEVEEVIRRHVASSSVPFVTDIAEYVIRNGGKRLRPALCLFSSRLVGTSGRKVVDCAAAMEFFHTATLMHDDVIDNAKVRRGKPAANSRWGNQIAVLVGDFFYCQASTLLVGAGNLKAIELVTKTMLTTTEGEILEITRSNDFATTEVDYLRIITEKTAILMAASCALGGILGNISEEFTLALGEYGKNLGIAFQLADDVLDYVSDESEFGKLRGTDLKEGKLTLPLLAALRHASGGERQIIKDALIAGTMEEARLKEVTSILLKHGGIDYTLNLAHSFVEKAITALAPFKPSIEKESLTTLARFVTERTR